MFFASAGCMGEQLRLVTFNRLITASGRATHWPLALCFFEARRKRRQTSTRVCLVFLGGTGSPKSIFLFLLLVSLYHRTRGTLTKDTQLRVSLWFSRVSKCGRSSKQRPGSNVENRSIAPGELGSASQQLCPAVAEAQTPGPEGSQLRGQRGASGTPLFKMRFWITSDRAGSSKRRLHSGNLLGGVLGSLRFMSQSVDWIHCRIAIQWKPALKPREHSSHPTLSWVWNVAGGFVGVGVCFFI